MSKLVPYKIKLNPNFLNRDRELAILKSNDALSQASIVVVSGRRRVGKTELIEQFYRDSIVFKFEGIQPDQSVKRTFQEELNFQISQCCKRLAKYTGQIAYSHLALTSWTDFFELLLPYVKDRAVILYFEEIQWLSNYSDRFTAEIKPIWDDHLRHNSKLRLVFSGSAPSFISKQFLKSSALYNRSTVHIALNEFSLATTRKFLSKLSEQEALIAHLMIGGIPEYLKVLKNSSSIIQGFVQHGFERDGIFFSEYEKIFVSSMSTNKHYKNIIQILAQKPYLNREEIVNKIGVTSNGSVTAVLSDLEECGFIASYYPLNNPESSRSRRYCIKDAYLMFYFKFIYPHRAKILHTDIKQDQSKWISKGSLNQALGYAFEKWCRFNPYHLAKCMKFDQIGFESGAFYSRKLDSKGIQIDLLFKREDYRIVVCEVKYSAPASPITVLNQLKEKASILIELHKKDFSKYSIEYALIVGEEIPNIEKFKNYFDYVVDLRSIFSI